jgi:hypothetical protein
LTLNGKLRPQQPGRVVGRPEYDPDPHVDDHSADVMWLVDSGANITTVRDCIGRQFGRKPVDGAFVFGANGETFGLVVDGLRAEFSVEDQVGKLRKVQTSGYMCIAPDDARHDLLGMDHVAVAGATLMWNPSGGAGSLRGGGLAANLAAVARGFLKRLTG